ncbi:hypothetical protein ACP4OV_005211 [Aristida adscensionis]
MAEIISSAPPWLSKIMLEELANSSRGFRSVSVSSFGVIYITNAA